MLKYQKRKEVNSEMTHTATLSHTLTHTQQQTHAHTHTHRPDPEGCQGLPRCVIARQNNAGRGHSKSKGMRHACQHCFQKKSNATCEQTRAHITGEDFCDNFVVEDVSRQRGRGRESGVERE